MTAQTHPHRSQRILTFCFLLCGLLSANVISGPYIDVGDEQTRHHLTLLRDSGILKFPLTTWPLPWADVAREVQNVEFDDLNDAQLWSLRYIKHALNQAERGRSSSKTLYGGNSIVPFTHFGSDSRDQASVRSTTNFMGESLSLNLRVKAVYEPIDNDDYQFDGSYLAATLGNWIIGVGSQERWWGPGWQSSLILSNNARTGMGAFARRKEALGFNTPLLSWIGPWSLDIFGERLSSDGILNDKNFYGARVSAAPTSFIEVSASQTLLVGREIEQNTLLGDIQLTTPKNAFGPLIKEGERRRQISYDARVNLSTRFASYAQVLMTSDSANSASHKSTLLGIESSFLIFGVHNRLIAEVSDPNTDIENQNEASEERVERFGFDAVYRYKLRSLGESAGYNQRKISIAGEHFMANGHQISWRYIDLSDDNSGDNQSAHDQGLGELVYKAPLTESLRVSVGAFFLKEKMTLGAQVIESGAHLQLEFRY